ncbi:ubiquitin carboxyl-terminal hydrolase 4 isoform X2 [Carcharodon carcharias]|uniref:ubiquitin carboxyl-terminal hydrolase 4 isoform X2 n=1 Tax=Carcharodon carcharias TaxID=13397 RepID=UPI001B7DAC9E|nr:ubiquitin carboxyl-terminal hydrolase 4 isoform X2 [Carcharodon carcharias]
MAEGGVPDLESQKNEIGNLLKTSLKKGDSWFLIDSRWFKQWKKYVGFDNWDMYNVGERGMFPGPIDNSGLFAEVESQVLKEHLIDELDYVLVPIEAWNKLVNWYACVVGQEPIVRKVVEHGMFVKHCKVEVYLLELKLCENNNMDNVVTRHFSKADTIDTIEKEMRKLFNISVGKETRLWNRYMTNTYEQLNKPDSTVQDAGLYQGQVLVIEQKNDDGTWPRQTSQTKPGGYGSSYNSSYNYRESHAPSQAGLCGLSNLGNTCFMNSALQCLSNTGPLTDYFLQGKYEEELNRENPLGMRGEIAEAYAELIKQMWSGRSSYVAPRMFKTQVGCFAPQFSGYQQQDSQELLAFLLDGLHEDLNRVKKKPYLELKDANGREDEVVAKEAWENHRLRNNSIIVDIFHGLFKSTLVCPECSKISVTFDPFCYLTLPLPMKKDRTMEIFLVRADSSRPTQYRIVVPKMGAISDLCTALSQISGVAAEKMVVADVYNHRFHKTYRQDEALNHIMDRDDIFVYEVPGVREEDSESSKCINLPVYFREKMMRSSNTPAGTILFGQPLLISVPSDNVTADSLYELVLARISRYVKLCKEMYESHSSGSQSTDNGLSGELNGINDEVEEEMDLQNVVGDNEENSSEPEISQSDGSAADENDKMENGPTKHTAKENKQNCKKKLFSFSLVNAYGTSDFSSITEDGAFLKLNSHSTVAIDWDAEIKKTYYVDQEAEAYEKHESMSQPQKKRSSVALRECIDLFTTMETLGEHDLWYCPTCKKHQQATKKFDLWSLPKILVVHLKRFSYNRYWRDKLDTLVEFPIRDLNMSEFVYNPKAGPCIYDLVAVTNHYGGMGGGHYTAYAKNKIDGQWYYFDDSSVSGASEDQIVTKAAYVLFYQRRDPNSHYNSSSASLSTPAAENGENRKNEDDKMDTN